MPKKPLSQHLWAVKMLTCPKDRVSLHGSIFVVFFDHSEMKLAWKLLF